MENTANVPKAAQEEMAKDPGEEGVKVAGKKLGRPAAAKKKQVSSKSAKTLSEPQAQDPAVHTTPEDPDLHQEVASPPTMLATRNDTEASDVMEKEANVPRAA